jgi:hypothetical protein
MRPYWRAFILVLSLAIPPSANAQGVPVHTIEAVKRSVVPIICGRSMENKEFHIVSVLGSGFLVNREGHFVTAAHVVEAWQTTTQEEQNCFPSICVAVDGWRTHEPFTVFRWMQFASCASDQEFDIAVCQILKNPFQYPETKNSISPLRLARFHAYQDGTPLAFTAFL